MKRKKIHEWLNEAKSTLTKRNEMKLERTVMLNRLEKTYRVKLPSGIKRNLGLKTIEYKLEKISVWQKRKEAALVIENWWMTRKVKARFKEAESRLHMAAFEVQKHWKRYLNEKKKSLFREKMKKAVIGVKCLWKTYESKMAVKALAYNTHIEKCIEFYTRLKVKKEARLGILVESLWKRVRARTLVVEESNRRRKRLNFMQKLKIETAKNMIEQSIISKPPLPVPSSPLPTKLLPSNQSRSVLNRKSTRKESFFKQTTFNR